MQRQVFVHACLGSKLCSRCKRKHNVARFISCIHIKALFVLSQAGINRNYQDFSTSSR